jgi:hypothetical protein
MAGLLINIAIPSLEQIEAMQDQKYLVDLLESANQAQRDLIRYRDNLIRRLLELRTPGWRRPK